MNKGGRVKESGWEHLSFLNFLVLFVSSVPSRKAGTKRTEREKYLYYIVEPHRVVTLNSFFFLAESRLGLCGKLIHIDIVTDWYE